MFRLLPVESAVLLPEDGAVQPDAQALRQRQARQLDAERGDAQPQQAAVDVWRMSLIDGSGLSRYNQVTPAQMLKVLDFTFHNHATNYAFVAALPVAGIDGTLKRRMRNIAWRVRAKTGTMQGVISLAGYAMSADREPIAFVIMINSKYGSVWQYRQLEDKIMQYLTHYSRGQG